MSSKPVPPKHARRRLETIGDGPVNAERSAHRGKAARHRTPRSAHAGFEPAADRPDPIALLERQGRSRVADLLPIRYGRMLSSPFAFFRGAALIMADDLRARPAPACALRSAATPT